MHPDRVAVFAVAGFVLLVAVATGPQLGLVSVPEGGLGGEDDPGRGTVALSVVSAPEEATIEADRYANVSYLRVPDTTVEVTGVTGAPLLTFSVDVQELGYQRSSVHTIGEDGGSTRTYGVDRAAIDPARLDQAVYEGVFRIVLNDDRGRTVVYEEPITVRVIE